jgi:hypothetical protein
MKIEISIGEAIDKLSILEIKYEKILNEEKKIEIKKEIASLNECNNYKKKYIFYYNILIYLNNIIWNITDDLQNLNIDDINYSELSYKLFEYNQKRFRLKRIFNLITSSNLNEQKNNKLKSCKIVINNKELFYDKLKEINSLLLDYDIIYFESSFNSDIQNIFNIPIFCYDNNNDNIKVFDLKKYNVEDDLKNIFEFPSITYVSTGRLGDFIHQLSVINENFYKYGKKGILYISDKPELKGDFFRFGLINTFNDTYEIIKSQKYIQDYKIYNNESFDINLSTWRINPKINCQTWYLTFKETYNVEWGKNKWINTIIDENFKNKILINTIQYMFTDNICYEKLYSDHGENILFIGMDELQYNFFINKTKIKIPFYNPKNFTNLCIAINSCKLFIGSRSAPLTIAHATFVNQIVGIANHDDNAKIHLNNIWNHLSI